MGWGERSTPALRASERLTARAEHDRCAKALADRVAAHLVSPTTGNAMRREWPEAAATLFGPHEKPKPRG